ncbi:hypothetical protein DFH08DRAFT_965624 [Mycena albidolilacea]|uniref:Uncharacterized protein n=1 Tax=Mycena albidolilacea TaxID=1033008 RepID=A0AAD6ZR23_9AGAR|nr:hypothetical protein DFH08DRAFT_965624 [Mycena albidolilacea]
MTLNKPLRYVLIVLALLLSLHFLLSATHAPLWQRHLALWPLQGHQHHQLQHWQRGPELDDKLHTSERDLEYTPGTNRAGGRRRTMPGVSAISKTFSQFDILSPPQAAGVPVSRSD